MAEGLSDIYAWTINFFKLQRGDYFKIIYDERVISDTISGGVDQIKAAYFSHRGQPFYAFRFLPEGQPELAPDYYDESTNNLRRASFEYDFDTSTTDSDPGTGKLRLERGDTSPPMDINCQLKSFDLSGHAGHSQIVDFINKCNPEKVILYHGDNREAFSEDLKDYELILPLENETIEIN